MIRENDVSSKLAYDSGTMKTPLKWYTKLRSILEPHRFLIGCFLAILVAFAHPDASWLKPEITVSWLLVMFIFLLSGLTLRTEEFAKAVTRIQFNAAVIVFNLGLLTMFIYGICQILVALGFNRLLADGMIICAALPVAPNSSSF